MNKETVTSMVNDEAKLEPWKRQAIQKILSRHIGHAVLITIERHYPTISGKQNRFLHGVFLPALYKFRTSAGEVITAEQNREQFKDKYGPHEPTRDAEGKWHYTPKSIADWTTKETEDAMEQCRADWAEWTELPIPNEDLTPPHQGA